MSQTRKPIQQTVVLVLGIVLAVYGVQRLLLALFLAQPAMELLVLEGSALVRELVLAGGAILVGGVLMWFGSRQPKGNQGGTEPGQDT
ncbi:MAG: hypothetical protein P1V36_14040 [Planctomycetota bacterium]|nr:hypothetical protein [Planctomycetota bacterium]